MKEENKNLLEKKYLKQLMVIMIAILFYLVLQNINSVMSYIAGVLSMFLPFYVGIAIAFILNVPMTYMEKVWFRKWKLSQLKKRLVAFIATLTGMVLIIYIVFALVVPELAITIQNLIDVQLPKFLKLLQGWLLSVEEYFPQYSLDALDWDNIMKEAVNLVQNTAYGVVSHTVGIVGILISGITTAFIGFIFAVYLIFQKETLASHFKKLFYAIMPAKKVDYMLNVLSLSNQIFSNFLSGQCMEAVILGGMFFVSMTIFKMPYALLIGVLIAITALIPMFGAFIGLGIGCFLIVMMNPVQALWFVVLFFVLQQIEGNFIYPYVVGNTVGLPAIWVLVAVIVGGNMLGVLGMLLFIPMFSVVYALLKEFVKDRLAVRKIPVEKYQVKEIENK
ncbi:MAG: AI-2E family transporter [Eubacteriales bacterium]